MSGLNNLVLFGHLVSAPEKRADELTVGVVAVNHRYKNSEGGSRDEVAFVPFTAFGKPALWVAECPKGAPILLAGRLRTEQWQNDGHPVSRLVMIVEKVQTFAGKPGSASPAEKSNNGKLPF